MKYVLTLILLVVALSTVMVGGLFSYPNLALRRSYIPQNTGARLIPEDPSEGKKSLQLKALNFVAPIASCSAGQKIAIDFLLDTSSSMRQACITNPVKGCKLQKLKEAVKTFESKLSQDDVIGVQRYSGGQHIPSEVVSIQPVSQIDKAKFDSAIDALVADGGTQTDKGLTFAQSKITTKFPKYQSHKKALILVTDGCPNSGTRAVDAANIIKADVSLATQLFTVGLELGTAFTNDRCRTLKNSPGYEGLNEEQAAKRFLELVASSNSFYDASSAENLQSIFDKIQNEWLCR